MSETNDYYGAKTGSVPYRSAVVADGYNGSTVELHFHKLENGKVIASYGGAYFSYEDTVEKADKRIKQTQVVA
jgi:hypothetical protein